jgi:hypothetical protein
MVDAEFRNLVDSSDSSPTANPRAPDLPTVMRDSQSAIGEAMPHLKVDILDVAVVDAARDDEANNSVSSSKSYHKNLCVHLTAALKKRKITEREAREENKCLTKELSRRG